MIIHERTFRVRHYECDAYGHVNHTNYLRYMQETAIDASAAAGYDMARYQAMGRHWLVHETDIEYLRPLRYNDMLQVKTWVQCLGRVWSRREYELSLADGPEEVAARAHTIWVFLETVAGRPTPIPAEMVAAFLPEGARPAAARQRFPAAPQPPLDVYTVRRRVEWRDIDPAGHVNNAAVMSYMEDAGVQVARHYGWSVDRMMAAGFAIVARRYRLQYLEPARPDDELLLATWVSDVKRATAMRHYALRRQRDRTLLARASAFWVWVDLATGRPVRIPPNFIADFTDNIVDGM